MITFNSPKGRIVFLVLLGCFILLAVLPLILLWTPVSSKLGMESRVEDKEGSNDKTSSSQLIDSDGDGLNDYLEIEIYHTNPNKKDTDDDGFNDNDEISLGFSPLSETKSKSDTDRDNLLNYQEIFVYLTDPNKKDTDGDGVFDGLEIVMGTNPLNKDDSQPYFIALKGQFVNSENSILQEDPFSMEIPALGIDVPIVWTQTSNNESILTDLKEGISHAYRTSFPGSGEGNGVYFGHSSGYWWGPARGDYDTVFATIENLEEGDEIIVQNPTRRYKYKVTKKGVTTPDDPAIFEQTDNESITLVTCYPLGTALKRLYVRAELDTEL